MSRFLKCFLFASFLVGCNQADEKVFADGGINEEKPVASLLEGLGGDSNAFGVGKKAEPAAFVTYSIEVTTKSGAKPCKGEVELELMTDFNVQLPTLAIQCLSMTIDLAGILGGAAGGGIGGLGKAEDSNISSDGSLLYIRKIAGAEFSPARPLLIGPVIQNPKKYKKYDKTTRHRVQALDKKTGQTISGEGEFTVEVHDVGAEFSNSHLDEPFENVIHWEMRKSGFDGLNASHGLIVDKMEWYWNMRPIMIPKIVIEGDFGEMIAANGDESTAAILGVLTITLEVKDYEVYD